VQSAITEPAGAGLPQCFTALYYSLGSLRAGKAEAMQIGGSGKLYVDLFVAACKDPVRVRKRVTVCVSFRLEQIEVTRYDTELDCWQAVAVTEVALLAALKPKDVAVIGFDHGCIFVVIRI